MEVSQPAFHSICFELSQNLRSRSATDSLNDSVVTVKTCYGH